MNRKRFILIFILSLGLATLAVTGLLVFFLYRYVWLTVSEVQTVALLQTEVTPVTLRRGFLENVLQQLEEKQKNLLEGKTIRDPF